MNPLPVWTNALWDLRNKYGRDFVDRLMFYSYENGQPPESDENLDDFLWSRFIIGLAAIDNNQENVGRVMEIMKSRGLPRQKAPQ
jgi:hypothetical protein